MEFRFNTNNIYVLVLKGFTVYLHFSQIYISKIMFNQIQYRGYCYEGEYLTNLGRIKVGVGLGVTNLAILLQQQTVTTNCHNKLKQQTVTANRNNKL